MNKKGNSIDRKNVKCYYKKRAESYFINLLENAKCRDVLEKEYHFTPNDFYVMNKEEKMVFCKID